MDYSQIKHHGVPNIAPCKDCKDRHIGCHGECKKYKKYKALIKKSNWTKKHLNY